LPKKPPSPSGAIGSKAVVIDVSVARLVVDDDVSVAVDGVGARAINDVVVPGAALGDVVAVAGAALGLNDRLSRIETPLRTWLTAHEGEGDAAIAARQQLVTRYYGAGYRYLLGMVRDPDAAEELAQDFALKLLRGDFKHFDPQHGRFRDFVKAALANLVRDYWQQKER
jgi:hypothetical protein